jgi:DNA replication and repair protein RecF
VATLYKPSLLLPVTPADTPAASAEIIAANRRRLTDLRDGEIALGSSLIGPHRDDVEFNVGGRPARDFASQGQQRTMVVAFKLAERQFFKERLGREPICLMDDMLSELDQDRRRNLQSLLTGGGQCLVTITSLRDWDASAPLPTEAAVIDVTALRSEKSQTVSI